MKKILLSIALILFAVNSYAATHYAASCKRDDVRSKIEDPDTTAGDTIIIPAGDCTTTDAWTSGINVTKKLYIQGSGRDASGTRILVNNYSNGYAFQLSAVDSTISNMWIKSNNSYNIKTTSTGFRVFNNKLESAIPTSKNYCVYSAGSSAGPFNPHGLVDGNILVDCNIAVVGAVQSFTSGDAGHTLWAAELALGKDSGNDIVYVENNSFEMGSKSYGNMMDNGYTGHYVARFNDYSRTNAGIVWMTHGMQSDYRWGRKVEVYNNKVTASTPYFYADMRSGTGVIFNNEFVGDWDKTNTDARLQQERATEAKGSCGLCDGDSPCDGNTDAYGYPCRDQIGRGKDASTASGMFGSSEEAPQTELMPVYFWNNKDTNDHALGVQYEAAFANHVKNKRDYFTDLDGGVSVGDGVPEGNCSNTTYPATGYWDSTNKKLYRCTASNTWTEYYEPQTCPHPLTGVTGGSCDYATAGTAGYSLTGGVSDTTPPTVTSFYIYAETTNINTSESVVWTSGAAFTVAGLDSALTLTCPGSSSGSSLTCANSRTVYQAEGNGTYGYTGDKVKDHADNALATIDNSPTAVNLSTEVEEPPAVTLTVTKTGTGCTITSSPSGIIAGTTTTADYDTGTVVTLGGYVEQGWVTTIVYGGDCASNGTVTMSSAKTCTATCTEKKVLNCSR